MPRAPIDERTVLVIIEADDPRDLRELLRVGLSLRTKSDVVIGSEVRMHVVAPRSITEAQSELAPVELRNGSDVFLPSRRN